MKEKRIKKIFELSKRKYIKENYKNWNKIFWTFAIVEFLFLLEIFRLIILSFPNIQISLKFGVFILYSLIFGLVINKWEDRNLAIFLKKTNCNSIERAKKLLKNYSL